MPDKPSIVNNHHVSQIIVNYASAVFYDAPIGYYETVFDFQPAAPVVEFCFLGLRHINELAVPNVINSQLTSLLRHHYSAITCIVQTVDMVVVQQTGIVGLRMFIGFEEIAIISIQASRCAHPNKAAAVLQQIANIVVGQSR